MIINHSICHCFVSLLCWPSLLCLISGVDILVIIPHAFVLVSPLPFCVSQSSSSTPIVPLFSALSCSRSIASPPCPTNSHRSTSMWPAWRRGVFLQVLEPHFHILLPASWTSRHAQFVLIGWKRRRVTGGRVREVLLSLCVLSCIALIKFYIWKPHHHLSVLSVEFSVCAKPHEPLPRTGQGCTDQTEALFGLLIMVLSYFV